MAAIVTALALAWLITMTSMAIAQYSATRDRLELLDREAKVATVEGRVDSYRKDLNAVASDLGRRQDFIEKMVEAHLGELPDDLNEADNASKDDAKAGHKVSAALPKASTLGQIEARQLAFVERLTRLADRRATQAAETIRSLGLNPRTMLARLDHNEAQGGPLISLATSANGSLDPRFRQLGVSLARMSLLERGLAGIPQVLPARLDFISSGFGYRSDPFTGEGAFHAGLDFRGPVGAPIYSAAPGKVSFAGVRQGYGNCVEIDHGNGLTTRYAHMSRIGARAGQKVDAGVVIGAIGSTGRSTGPHLHFEVRVHDRPVNPRPFLEAASHVPEEARSGH